MTNFFMIEKSYEYSGDLTLGKELNVTLKKEIISIYDLEIQKVFITNRVYKKYLKLLKMVNFYLNSEDDTGTAYHEALNEIEKFRQLVKNKYRKYLLDETLKEMSKELTKKMKDAKKRILYVDINNYANENKHIK